jgi:hypothetical protein
MTGRKLSFALALTVVVAVGNVNGGYYPTSWGWTALAATGIVIAALVARRSADLSGREMLMLAAAAGLAGWTAATAFRPGLATNAVPELERDCLYLVTLWASMLVLSRRSAAPCLAGLLAGIVAIACRGLVAYLFPGRLPNVYEGRLLYQPLGYANAAGVMAAMGTVIALGFVVRAPSARLRALAAGALVPLLATIAYSASRGAAVALALVLALTVAIDPLRWRVAASAAVVLPLPLLAVWAGSRTHFGDPPAPPSVVMRDGHVLAALLVVLTLAQVAVAHAVLRDRGFVRDSRRLGQVVFVAASVLAAGRGSVAFMRGASGLGDRPAFWRAAWVDYLAHPIWGSGAGSFGAAWLRYRTIPVATLDAHNLYLETLAEVGPVGLALLALFLIVPLTVAARAFREQPLVVPAAGAYAVFLLHAAVDWDWEIPAVTIVGLICVAAVLAAAREPTPSVPRRSWRAAPWLAASVALAAAWLVAIVGNNALSGAARSADAGSWTATERLAKTASRWQPWSAEPVYLLGEAQLARGDRADAHRSFERALAHDPRDWRTWYELARTTTGSKHDNAVSAIAWLNPMAVRLVP